MYVRNQFLESQTTMYWNRIWTYLITAQQDITWKRKPQANPGLLLVYVSEKQPKCIRCWYHKIKFAVSRTQRVVFFSVCHCFVNVDEIHWISIYKAVIIKWIVLPSVLIKSNNEMSIDLLELRYHFLHFRVFFHYFSVRNIRFCCLSFDECFSWMLKRTNMLKKAKTERIARLGTWKIDFKISWDSFFMCTPVYLQMYLTCLHGLCVFTLPIQTNWIHTTSHGYAHITFGMSQQQTHTLNIARRIDFESCKLDLSFSNSI